MSTIMVMLKETEQLHKNMTEEKTVTPTSDHSFDFDKASPVNKQASDDISSQNSLDTEIFPFSSDDDELCNAENTAIMQNKRQSDHEFGRTFPPPSEPILEKPFEPINLILDVQNQIDRCNQSNISVEGEVKRHDQETSDDDLLEELDKVVTASNDKDVEPDGEEDNTISEQENNLMSKKMEALKRRMDYTIQERKHLEIENINLERKIDALLRNHALESKEILGSMEVQKDEIEELKKRLYQQNEANKLEVQKRQTEHQKEVENLQKRIEECKKEKDDVVVRFAIAEQKNIDMANKLQKSDMKLKEWSKERETALSRWKTMKSENKRAFDICEAQKNEINQLKKDNERLKDQESSSDTKLKWHQNKLKVEQDGHKETSAKLLEQNKILSDIQIHLFTMFDTVRSVYSVLQELHTCQSSQQAPPPTLPPSPKQDASVIQLVPVILKDLQTLLWKQREILAETRTYKDKIHCLELERLSQQEELVSLKDVLEIQKQDNAALVTDISRLQDIEKEQQSLITELESISRKAADLEASNVELSAELKSCQSWETENMEFNSRLMSSNSELKAINDALKQELDCKSLSLESMQDQLKSLKIQLTQLNLEKEENSRESFTVIENLRSELKEANRKVEALKTKKEELEDEIKTIKRRYAAMVKDLKRHMTSGGRQPLTSDDMKSQVDTNSLCSSHGGSSLSLDTHAGLANNHQPSTPPSQVHSSPKPSDQSSANQCEPVVNGDPTEEKENPNITLLLKHLERKTRKVNFLKEHVNHLTEELHSKSKIIREYTLREESGSLVPEASDKNKAQISRKGGIMASLYSLNAKDSGMTLSLSMEINQKLQALVEDSLLKNIKYKESMDLLGREIEWLSNENKSLRSQLNEKESIPLEAKKTSDLVS